MAQIAFDLANAAVAAALVCVLLAVVLARLGRHRFALLGLGAGIVWVVTGAAGLMALTQTATASASAQTSGDPCPPGAPTKTFNVSLINIPLFLNRFGDVVPEGRMYILDENIATARASFINAANPFRQDDVIEPLVLRANEGDCVEVSFTNRLNEPAPNFNRNDAIFPLPGETLRAPGTPTPGPREFAPARTQPENDFDPARAPRASMHFTGLDYDVKAADGTAAGNNPDSTVVPGASTTYRLYADEQGEFRFADGADSSSGQAGVGNFIGSQDFGAFGGVLVEPAGTTFVDTRTGQPIRSGTRAIIKDPNGPDFREHVRFMHGEVQAEPGILTRFCVPSKSPAPVDGEECVNPTNAERQLLQQGTLPGLGGGDADALVNGEIPVKLEWFAFNYRSEPGFNREEVDCPALTDPGAQFQAPECVGEETSLSSWPFGDPGGGDLVFHNYRNEPTVTRLFHGGGGPETHTYHQHVNRWPQDPADEGGIAAITHPAFDTKVTNPIDTQAISPGEQFSLVFEGGAGSPHDNDPGSVGDVIFHCHLYPHFANGMWGLDRIHDVAEDGTRVNPDTTPIPPLQPLEDFPAPPAPTLQRPGFPFFVPGEFGFKAPKPPLGVPQRQPTGSFPPTAQETAAAQPDAQKPGAFFVDYCPPNAPVKVFHVAAIQLDVTYNDELGWRNPQQRIYVLQEDKQAVLSGQQEPEPFAPLLNVGDCVEYHLTNELPEQYGGTVFDRAQQTNEVSIHQHLVQFDVLSSDGAANGWNYDQGADPGQTIVFRDFVQAPVRTNSFHDHFFPNVHQDAGLFGGGTVHPAGCTFHDRHSGEPVRVGTLVDVRCDPATDYRSYSLFVEDQVPMFAPEDPANPNDDSFVTPDGVPVYPAKFPSSNDDRGAMGVNYSAEPFEARRDADPANLFDSKTHGDPDTPIPRAMAGDRVKYHLFQLSMEESHGFNLHRFRWKQEPNDAQSRTVASQHIGMLEYFDFVVDVDKEGPNPKGVELLDYLYNYGGADDWFMGTWGLFRVEGCDVPDQPLRGLGIEPIQELPDNPVPNCNPSTAPPQRTPGNPCPTDASGAITAPIRRYEVVATNHDVVYNNAGEHDPDGVIYVLKEDLAAVKNGLKPAEPLIIRANTGDCIEVTLDNQLDPAKMAPHCFEALEPGQLGFEEPTAGATLPDCLDEPPDNEVNIPGFRPFPVSARVSLHPSLVDYHLGSDGANVGMNFDSTVGPGESILYRWFAPEETGLGVLQDRADVQNHLHHGLFGGLVIEPKGSTYLDPSTGMDTKSGQQAVIADPGGPDFRENIVLLNSDLSLFRPDGTPVPDNVDIAVGPSKEADDPEDMGEFAVGYRNEPWNHRIAANPDLAKVFSTPVHGDPATPLFRAYAGDHVRFRVAQAMGDPRSTSFTLHGHRWRAAPDDPGSNITTTQGRFNPTVTHDVDLDPNVFGGAGGPHGFAGDYLYRSSVDLRHLPGGQWGLLRVFDQPQPNLVPLPDRAP